MSEEDFDKVLEVNLKSVFNMTKAVQRTMLKQRSGSIINMATNSDEYCHFSSRFNRQSFFPASRHAEIACCLNQPASSTNGAVLYVVRVRKDGTFGMSKPCEVCQGAMKFLNIKKIYYSTPDGIEEMRLQ